MHLIEAHIKSKGEAITMDRRSGLIPVRAVEEGVPTGFSRQLCYPGVEDAQGDEQLRSGGAMIVDIDQFYRTFVQETSDAVVYADAEGRISFWNKGAERIFGFAASEAIGESLDIIIPENLRERHWKGYAETMHTGQTRYGAGDLLAVPALRKDGARISVQFTILPFRDGSGRLLGIAATLRDVTKQFEEMKALRKARQL
jgi:PAS domain S-box-containing protein